MPRWRLNDTWEKSSATHASTDQSNSNTQNMLHVRVLRVLGFIMEAGVACALPWLCPSDVASVALSCKSLASAARELTMRRMRDVARGMEPWPVPIAAESLNQGYPYFDYSPCCIGARNAGRFSWGSLHAPTNSQANDDFDTTFAGQGCDCKHCGDLPIVLQEVDKEDEDSVQHESDGVSTTSKKRRACPCRNAFGAPSKVLRSDGESLEDLSEEGLSSIHECGAACACSPSCIYRATQRGLSAKVKVSKSLLKGWGLYAAQEITRGSFVCVYAGELLTTHEARKRQKAYDSARRHPKAAKQVSALLVLREHLPSGHACLRVNIDATHVGNLARFINHSCDGGNLSPCLIRSAGSCFPRLGFFASRHIQENEELTFSYGTVEEAADSQPCSCGTPACLGVLPSERT